MYMSHVTIASEGCSRLELCLMCSCCCAEKKRCWVNIVKILSQNGGVNSIGTLRDSEMFDVISHDVCVCVFVMDSDPYDP